MECKEDSTDKISGFRWHKDCNTRGDIGGNEMHIAVAIPTHDRVKQLKRCIDSILSQQLSPEIKLSLVISNNGSEDGTADYLDALANTDPRVVIFSPCMPISTCSNFNRTGVWDG